VHKRSWRRCVPGRSSSFGGSREVSASISNEALAIRRDATQLFTAAEVSLAIERMAWELTPRLADRNPVVLTVMHGGAFTAAELCRHFDFPYEVDYVHPTRYGEALEGAELHWRVRPAPKLAGRVVLVVDDILDRGLTLRALNVELERVGVAQRLTAVLIVKRLTSPAARPGVDAVGLTVDDVYVFGSGMDYKGYWRGLPGLYAVATAPVEPS
jgi:hypoxanthine phosphoribosyltransferase